MSPRSFAGFAVLALTLGACGGGGGGGGQHVDAAIDGHAAVDAHPHLDGPAVTADAPAVTGCDFAATYYEPISLLYWRYKPNGTWQTASTVAGLDAAPRSTGHWMLAGTTVSTDDIGSPSPNACPATQIGTYTVSFTGPCTTMTWTLQADACSPRANYLDGAPRTRQ